MRKKLNQHLFVYLLILSLVITLGMNVQPLNNTSENHVLDVPERNVVSAISTEPLLAPTKSSAITPIPISRTSTIPATSAIAPIPADPPPIPTADIPAPTKEETAITEELVHTYEVTAFYLNVRTEPNAKSAIQKVVKQATRLEIIAETENGWLQLQSGGYIHGGYAKKVKNEATILSFSVTDTRQPTIEIQEIGAEQALESETIDELPDEEPTQPTSIVESESGLTEEHIAKIFEGTALSGEDLEQAILEIEEEYGINAYFTIAVMKLESGNGKSRLAKNKNNLFGLNAIDGDKYNKAFSFETKGDSVRKFGQLLSRNYVGKGLTTIEKVAKKYCPANSKWPSLVKSIMKSDYRKL
ncbi:glucosaminidase domain-containing protein [Paenibacillus luteus]|uniref:glucosaminidase domain-containing protein n=1 Tax=Paenibacillus luteus TaxID=2545753 RepID=UPI001143D07A|nr:glucosaminidase domain-containing protein [Paenibacillus luteus]